MGDPYLLNLRHVRMLVVIEDQRTISGAARDLSISQPALTQALAKLEGALGVAVFERQPGGVQTTRAGRRILLRVRRALALLDEALLQQCRDPQSRRPDKYLTTSHVRALVALAGAGSFVAAAEETRLSVPSIYAAVRDLEKLSGVSLTERRGRGVGLTPVGAGIARGFHLAMIELGAIFEEREGGGRLAIGAMALSRSVLLPTALADILTRTPSARVDVVEGSYLELVELLRGGRIDILLGALRTQEARDIVQEPLFTNSLTIIGRAGHPLAEREADFDDLAAYPWIVARRASGLLARWQEMFDAAGKRRPLAPVQCGSVALIRGLLVRSDHLTLLSVDQVAAEIDSGALVRIRSCVPDTLRTIGVMTRRGWYPTPLQQQFMELLREDAQALAQPGFT